MKIPLLFLAIVTPLTSLFAGNPETYDAKVGIACGFDLGSEVRFKAEALYTFEGDFKDSSLGSQDALETNVRLEYAVGLDDSWKLVVGGAYERFDFGSSLAPVPTTLQGAAGVIGLEWYREGQRAAFISSRPGLYAAGDDLGEGAFDIPTILAMGFRLNPNLIGAVGVRASLRGEYPVLPIAGFIWTIKEGIVLDAMMPSPQLRFTVGEGCTLAVGASLTGGAYETPDDDPRFPSTTVDYHDIRTGIELAYEPNETWKFSVQGGWSIRRQFEYDDYDETFRTEGAPYAGLQVRAVF